MAEQRRNSLVVARRDLQSRAAIGRRRAVRRATQTGCTVVVRSTGGVRSRPTPRRGDAFGRKRAHHLLQRLHIVWQAARSMSMRKIKQLSLLFACPFPVSAETFPVKFACEIVRKPHQR